MPNYCDTVVEVDVEKAMRGTKLHYLFAIITPKFFSEIYVHKRTLNFQFGMSETGKKTKRTLILVRFSDIELILPVPF